MASFKNLFLGRKSSDPSSMTIIDINSNVYFLIFIAIAVIGITVGLIIMVKPKNNNNNGKLNNFLTLNTSKSFYSPGDKVMIYISSLDENYDNICHSNFKIIVTGPSNYQEEISTQNGKIALSTTCDDKNRITNNPDHQGFFEPTEEGIYTIIVLDNDTNTSSELKIIVTEEQKFRLERSGAIRVDPNVEGRYHMNLKITSQDKFEGQVIEYIPSFIDIAWKGEATIEDFNPQISKSKSETNLKKISWDVEINPGETKELIYEYFSPKEGQTFSLGKAQIISNGQKVYEEENFWKILIQKYNQEKINEEPTTSLLFRLPFLINI